MKRKGRYLFILLILFISIGFAFVSTNLNILGTTLVSKQKWDIHFENPTKVGGNVDATELNLDGDTTVNFKVDLYKPTDTYEFTIDVVNNGTINGMIKTITSTELTDEQKKIFEYVITYDDGASLKEKQVLKVGERHKYKVTVRYKDDIQESDLSLNDQTVEIEFHVEYVQADNTWIEKVNNSFVSVYNQATPGELVQGDEVNIGNEHFYIVNYGEDKVILLAKYLLNVGPHKNPYVSDGIQDRMVSEYKQSDLNVYGVVPFSNNAYWLDSSGNFLDGYENTHQYSTEVYNSAKSASSGDDYSVAYYVNQYVNKLENDMNAIISKGRLLTYVEARNLGCDTAGTCDNAPDYVKHYSYWLSSAFTNNEKKEVWTISSNEFTLAAFGYSIYSNNIRFGVRPIIEISREYL